MKPIQNALLSLSYYIDESIAFLREHEPQEGYFVGFSGGKDSIVTLALCRMAGVKHTPYYTYTTIDPPEVAKFIRTEYPDVQWLRPAKSFFALLQRNAPPYGCKDGVAIILKKCLRGMFLCTSVFLGYAPKKARNVPLVAVYPKLKLRGGYCGLSTSQFSIGPNGLCGTLSRFTVLRIRRYMMKALAASGA